MSIRTILEERFPYNSTELVVSNEGLVSAVRSMFGKSNKGDARPDEAKKDIMMLKDLIANHYTKPAWLKSQTYTTGEMSGAGIIGVLGKNIEEIPMVLKRAETEMLQYLEQWDRALKSNHMNHLVIAKATSKPKDFTPELLKETKKHMENRPPLHTAHVKFPEVFKATGRKLVKGDNGAVKAGPTEKDSDTKILPLGKDNVQRIAKMLEVMISRYFDAEIKCYFTAHATWEELKGDEVLKLAERDASVKPWADMIRHLHPTKVIYSNPHISAFTEIYMDTVMAACRWIDRSIK